MPCRFARRGRRVYGAGAARHYCRLRGWFSVFVLAAIGARVVTEVNTMTIAPTISEDPAASRPYYRLLGLRAEAGVPAGHSVVRLESHAELENSRGDVHGGVLASMLDAAMSMAVRSLLANGEGVATVSLTVNYLEPGNAPLIAKGRVVRSGRTISSAEAVIEDSSGRTVAHAVATMRIIARQK